MIEAASLYSSSGLTPYTRYVFEKRCSIGRRQGITRTVYANGIYVHFERLSHTAAGVITVVHGHASREKVSHKEDEFLVTEQTTVICL